MTTIIPKTYNEIKTLVGLRELQSYCEIRDEMTQLLIQSEGATKKATEASEIGSEAANVLKDTADVIKTIRPVYNFKADEQIY